MRIPLESIDLAAGKLHLLFFSALKYEKEKPAERRRRVLEKSIKISFD